MAERPPNSNGVQKITPQDEKEQRKLDADLRRMELEDKLVDRDEILQEKYDEMDRQDEMGRNR